jgi:uncharacterized membrane protein
LSEEILSIFNLDSYDLINKKEVEVDILSIYEKGVIMSDSGANVIIIRDEELFNTKRLTRVLKNIHIRGVRDGTFLCEAMGYL